MRFGVRDICDMTFKSTDKRMIGNREFNPGQPVFMIETATTSSLEQATTTVYARGGSGYNRLIAWEGEKEMTVTIEDALMSPMGLAVLSGAGLIQDEENIAHIHITYDVQLDDAGKGKISYQKLLNELGVAASDYEVLHICKEIPVYGTVLDGSGAGVDWIDNSAITIAGETFGLPDETFVDVKKGTDAEVSIDGVASRVVKLDFYVAMSNGVTTVDIKPEDFGGYFYVEADTLFRREDTGKDMAATLTFPKVKVQSGFTFTMAATGDPSTFTFTMDAFPGYTYFDATKKVCCVITIVGVDSKNADQASTHPVDHVIETAGGEDEDEDVVTP